ncbi:hypothetical protein [Cellulophaga tyrosinoxydans]|uniref:Uncharacterized protein n=1 Tax=Cellulophaga tyrosinoxydans TaxID=504486 RepID=A0A1W2CRM1_9FLAO|nr:hypothetical protein [Cellulophaga tyrosinoxydans]SMC87880.1 hypothetical protein SAMN05660703_3163 [Cellulophaga tyrosinoxydans]
MKTLKIIIGFLLLYGAGKEYIDASTQLGSFYEISIIIPIFLLIILCTWLIGSGFSVRKFKFKSFEFVKFFIISFVTFATVAIFSIGSKIIPSNFVVINGIKVPLGKCIDGNRRIIPDEKEREEYCKCFIEKITNQPELKSKYQKKLEDDKVNDVFKEIQSSPKFLELDIEDCMSSIKMKWTDNIANSMKRNWKKELIGTEFESTNDIEKYCDCLVDEYRKFPLEKIMEDGFAESKEAVEIDEKCTKQSEK